MICSKLVTVPDRLALRQSLLTFPSLLLAAALCACGGGGGGAGGGSSSDEGSPPLPVPAPAPIQSLTVVAGAAEVSAGAEPVSLRAVVRGASDVPAWTLSGPGLLSNTRGYNLVYTPPDIDGVDEAATAVITATVAPSLTYQVRIDIEPMKVPGRRWSVARPETPLTSKVAYGNGLFVALQRNFIHSSFSTSSDGVNWTAQKWDSTNPWYDFSDAVWGPNGWVAVDGFGHTATSRDGVQWDVHRESFKKYDGAFYWGQLVTGNGVYIIYGTDATYVSEDGVKWSEVPIRFADIAFGNGMFMGLGPDPAKSGDYLGWQAPYASVDGRIWHQVTHPGHMNSITFRTTDFAGLVGDGISSTFQGGTWIATLDPTLSASSLDQVGNALFLFDPYSLSVMPEGAPRQAVTGFDVLSVPRSIAFGHGRYVGVSEQGWISTSPDAVNWTTAVEGSVGNLTAVAFFNENYVALSDAGWAMRSVDARNWTRSTLPEPGFPGGDGVQPMAMAHGAGVLVAVGRDPSPWDMPTRGMWMRSIDGVSWVRATTPAPSAALTAVLHDGRRFLATDQEGSVYESTDGDVWASVGAIAGAKWAHGIAYGGGVYVAVGGDGLVASSTDAVHWAVGPKVVGPGRTYDDFAPTVRAVTWDGTRFIAVGDSASATSVDGRNWTMGNMQLPGSAVAAANGLIISMSPGGVLSSLDGLHWRVREQSHDRGGSGALVYAQGRFVGVSERGKIVVSGD